MKDLTIIIKTFMRPNALDTLLKSIRTYYDEILIYVADDSPRPIVRNDVGAYFTLPFDSGISYGRNFLVDKVDTEYLLLLDDDTVFTNRTNLEWPLFVLRETGGIDLVAGRYYPEIFYGKQNIVDGALIREMRQCTRILEGYPTFDFVPNFFVARTHKIREVWWDEELKLQEHMDFFWRARDTLRCTYLPYFLSINSHTKESEDYEKFRSRSPEFQKLQCRKLGVNRIISRDNKANYTKKDVCRTALKAPFFYRWRSMIERSLSWVPAIR